MSDLKAAEKSVAPQGREPIRIRVEKLRQSRRRSIIGVPELAGLAASALMLLTVVIAFFFFLRPASANLDALQRKREETYKRLEETRTGVKTGTDQQVTIAEVTQSVTDFETNRLSSRGEGRLTLLDNLNKLIRSNGLRNTSGPNYSALDALATEATSSGSKRTGSAKWQSLYPGLGISVTVEGAYPALRRFVREIETGNQFIIINSVELEKATDSGAVATVPGEAAKPIARGSLVSLRLDMAAYFRREAAAETESVPATETR